MAEYKLSEQLSTRTAGSLPSQRTKDVILRKALESDNILEVKGALAHVWLHYEALELALHDQEANAKVLADTKQAIAEGVVEDDVNDWDKVITAGLMADGIIESAYDMAHQAGTFSQVFGSDLTNSLPDFFFRNLDFSDPERELSEAELAKLSGQAEDVAEDEL